MNWYVFFVYTAIGAIAELLTMRNPSPGQQWAASGQVVIGGVCAGLVLPDSVDAGNTVFLMALALPALMRVLGVNAAPIIDRERVRRMLVLEKIGKEEGDGYTEEDGRERCAVSQSGNGYQHPGGAE